MVYGLGCLALSLLAAASAGAQTPAQPPHAAEHHEFVIDNFHTESGATLPKARIVYGTYGHLNAARDNVVLLPSHYMANHHGYEWLIGPDRALDASTLFLVATELFGNGHSSSPSNTPEPFHGPRFPINVEKALRSIAVPVLYMPSETDLYFPVGDARHEAQFIRRVSLVPIPSLWGHPAGAGGNPADRAFLNETISRFLAGLQ